MSTSDEENKDWNVSSSGSSQLLVGISKHVERSRICRRCRVRRDLSAEVRRKVVVAGQVLVGASSTSDKHAALGLNRRGESSSTSLTTTTTALATISTSSRIRSRELGAGGIRLRASGNLNRPIGCSLFIMRPLILGLIVVTVALSLFAIALKLDGDQQQAQQQSPVENELLHQDGSEESETIIKMYSMNDFTANGNGALTWYDRMMKPVVGLFGYSDNNANNGGNKNEPTASGQLVVGKFPRVPQGYLNQRRPTSGSQLNAAAVATDAGKQHTSLLSLVTESGSGFNGTAPSAQQDQREANSIREQNNQLLALAPAEAIAPNQQQQQHNGAITIDKIKGIDLSRMAAFGGIGNGKDSEDSSTMVTRQAGGNYVYKNAKCHNNKYDRLIAQKISLNDLSRPIVNSDGRYENPFPTWSKPSMVDLARFLVMESDESNVPKNKLELDKELPVLKPDFSNKQQQQNFNKQQDAFRVTWIGHSTLLIQVDGFNILTDPIFSERASPTQFFGPKRFRDPACDIKSLPRIDIVLVSHNHYDHLDAGSVKELNERFGNECRWIVPLGLGEFLQSMSVENYVELDWWQKDCHHIGNSPTHSTISTNKQPQISARSSSAGTQGEIVGGNGSATPGGVSRATRTNRLELNVYLTPSQHWSRRGVNDVNKSLWGSYTIVSGNGSTFFFAGDTGYCSAFKEIGKLFGPFTGAAIPIGAYKPRWFLKPSHVDPSEAVQIHRDLRSMKSIAIHHSTFVLSNEPYQEPAKLLGDIMNETNQRDAGSPKDGPFTTMNLGETIEFSKTHPLPVN